MIFGNNMHKNIKGIGEILHLKPDFKWNELCYIEQFNYKVDVNNYGEQVSYLSVNFRMNTYKEKILRVSINFSGVNNFKIEGIGGSYNQIMGFSVVDQHNNGWENDKRYFIEDYEDGRIHFYCSSIEILSVN